MKRPLAAALLPLIGILAAGCAPSLTELKASLPESTADSAPVSASLFKGDAPGEIAAARRLCHPLLTREQRALGLSLALDAQKNAAPEDKSSARNAALIAAKCAALASDDAAENSETEAVKRTSLIESGIAAALAAGSREVLDGTCRSGEANAKAENGAADSPPACSQDALRAAYFHAVLLGQKMRSAGMSEALKLLDEEVRLLEAAQSVASEDQGGPMRVLGLLLLKAPGWPAGPGDIDRALSLLTAAAERYPSHPLNHLFLAEALREDGDMEGAKAHLQTGLLLADEALWGEAARRWRDTDALFRLGD